MDDMLNGRNIQAPRSKIGGDEYLIAAVAKFDQRQLPLILLQLAVIHIVNYSAAAKQRTDAVHGIAVVAKHQRGFVAD